MWRYYRFMWEIGMDYMKEWDIRGFCLEKGILERKEREK